MKSRAAAKGRRLSLLAAVCLISTLLAAPMADASRSVQPTLAPALEHAPTPAEALGLEATSAQPSYRLFGDLSLPERPLELVQIRKTASGVLTCELRLNVLQKGGLSKECGGLSFQGLWTDPVTGISYARNRWYDARTASWLSEDPKGAVDSPNLYAFVGWGPHSGRDPMGLGTDFNVTPEAIEYRKEQARLQAKWCRENPVECARGKAKFHGVLMMGAGLLEGLSGLAGCYFTGGLGCVAGAGLVTHGADTMDTGRQMWKAGEIRETRTFRLFESGYGAFLSPEHAATAARYTEILGPAIVGAGMARSAMSMQARAPALSLGTKNATGRSAPATSGEFSLFGRRTVARWMLQRHTTRTNNRLASNPALAQDVLSDAEYAAGQRNYRVAPMQFGNAEERLAAETIEESYFSSRLFEHVGGPSNPDFVGRGVFRGLNFDITTPGQVEAHLARPVYGEGLIITTYERPQSFRLFPETPAEALSP